MNTTAEKFDLKEKLVADFHAMERGLNGESKTSFHARRRAALEKFRELGFPTMRHEEWKYTNIQPLVSQSFQPAADKKHSLTRNDIAQFLFPELQETVLVFVNGFFAKELSILAPQKDGIYFGNFAEARNSFPSEIEQYFASITEKENSFVALNTAFAQDGAFIRIADGKLAEQPIHILSLTTGAENLLAQPRNLLVFGKNSAAKVIFSSHSLAPGRSLSNIVTEVFVAENANIELITIQNDAGTSSAVNQLYAKQERSSNFTDTKIILGGAIVRNNVTISIDGEGAEAHMNGLSLTDADQLVDNHTLVVHAVPNCQSNELYKSILDGSSTGVFNGKIFVAQDAQKTNAFQSNRNILLSQNATMNTKPQLEIFADDVKCSHGATVGQLDEESLFYLRARGLDRTQAQALLLSAFAGEVIEKISVEELRSYLTDIISARLHNEIR